MILLIDNFDPHMREFYKYISSEHSDITVIRNDECLPDEVMAMQPDAVIIGSGVGNVEDTGICKSIIENISSNIPLLAFGLGAEVLANCLGASYINTPVQGDTIYNISFDKSCSIFKSLSDVVPCASNIKRTMNMMLRPENIIITAQDQYGRCIAFKDAGRNAFGICTYPVFLNDSEKSIIHDFISLIVE